MKNGGGGKLNHSQAFTLAEVLITLGIIGIVAAMTMPTLIQKHQERVTVTKLKKFMSVMNNAVQMAINENGPIETWSLTNSVFDENAGSNTDESLAGTDYFMRNYILPYVKYTKYCSPTDSSCHRYERYSLDGTRFGSFTEHVLLADGSVINGMWISDSFCNSNQGDSKQLRNVCGQIFYDTNGRTGPNKTGVDVFLFYFTKYGVIPLGTALETKSNSFDKMCNLSTSSRLNGYGCAAWVIYNENMDYLHCNDLSWDGKKKCK